MSGAALLAGRAALHAGAGRVFVALLGGAGAGTPLTGNAYATGRGGARR